MKSQAESVMHQSLHISLIRYSEPQSLPLQKSPSQRDFVGIKSANADKTGACHSAWHVVRAPETVVIIIHANCFPE